MIIKNVQNFQDTQQVKFTGGYIQKEAVSTYRRLNPEFLNELEKQGVTQGLVVSFINRLLLHPNFKTFSSEQICKILACKIEHAVNMFKRGCSVDEIAKEVKTEKRRVVAFVNKQELLKRNNDIAEAFLNGESIRSLAARQNLTYRAIGLILAQKGISPELLASEKRNSVISMVKNSFTDELISDTLGLPKKRIESIRAHNKLMKNRSNLPDAREQLIIEQIRAGKNRVQLSNETGISLNVINNISKKFKVKQTLLNERNEKIIQMFQDNIPAKDIAKEFNIDVTVIYKIAKKYNFRLS